MSDVAFIYPITPSTPGNELSDQLATEGRRNLHGNIMQVGSVNRLLTRPLGSCKLQAPKGWQIFQWGARWLAAPQRFLFGRVVSSNARLVLNATHSTGHRCNVLWDLMHQSLCAGDGDGV